MEREDFRFLSKNRILMRENLLLAITSALNDRLCLVFVAKN